MIIYNHKYSLVLIPKINSKNKNSLQLRISGKMIIRIRITLLKVGIMNIISNIRNPLIAILRLKYNPKQTVDEHNLALIKSNHYKLLIEFRHTSYHIIMI
jgi:hypothetical protein